jgi:hypothetical protein
VIIDFTDLFQAPNELPPQRSFDHAVPLLPNTIPINCRSYIYAPQQKDEIEKQVDKMLKSDLIVPSHSSFASPVLLVKKKDSS